MARPSRSGTARTRLNHRVRTNTASSPCFARLNATETTEMLPSRCSSLAVLLVHAGGAFPAVRRLFPSSRPAMHACHGAIDEDQQETISLRSLSPPATQVQKSGDSHLGPHPHSIPHKNAGLDGHARAPPGRPLQLRARVRHAEAKKGSGCEARRGPTARRAAQRWQRRERNV